MEFSKILNDGRAEEGALISTPRPVSKYFEMNLELRSQSDTSLSFTIDEKLLQCVKEGNLPGLKIVLREMFSNSGYEFISVSSDRLVQARYIFVINLTTVTKAALTGGLNPEISYSLSDAYIRYMDELNDLEEIAQLGFKAIYDFTNRIRNLKNAYPKPIRIACSYIQTHLYSKISRDELCRETGLSPSYLSMLFKKSTGTAISQYIIERKLESAAALLLTGNLSIADICTRFAIGSQSNFTAYFKRVYGITPSQYREGSSLYANTTVKRTV